MSSSCGLTTAGHDDGGEAVEGDERARFNTLDSFDDRYIPNQQVGEQMQHKITEEDDEDDDDVVDGDPIINTWQTGSFFDDRDEQLRLLGDSENAAASKQPELSPTQGFVMCPAWAPVPQQVPQQGTLSGNSPTSAPQPTHPMPLVPPGQLAPGPAPQLDRRTAHPATPADLLAQAEDLKRAAAQLEAQAMHTRNLNGAVRHPLEQAQAHGYHHQSPVMSPWHQPVDMYAMPQMAGAVPGWTTVMLRNIPNNFTRTMLLSLLDQEGFAAGYDFIYLPMDFKRNANLGYAFLNLISPKEADRFHAHFHGWKEWGLASQKIGEVGWGEPLQGLDAHIERYRNSPVMHGEVPDEHKPVLFKDGQRIPFPKPTRRLRAPRIKEGQA